jgi:hypothetical protein
MAGGSPSPSAPPATCSPRAANVIAGTTIDLIGAIGCRVLAGLLPGRRLRQPQALASTGAATPSTSVGQAGPVTKNRFAAARV